MRREILLYGAIHEDTASAVVLKLIEAEESGQEVVLRVNTPGGEPEYTWGIVSKFSEIASKKSIMVDGQAMSGGTFLCCYAKDVEAIDTAEFLIHRAAYPPWIEKNPDIFTEPMRQNLERINTSLRKAVEGRIDVDKFEKMKGCTLKDVFSMDQRMDVFLSAKEAKAIGLIDRIVKITPEKRAELETLERKSSYSYYRKAAQETEKPTTQTMTIEKLKAEHPEVFAAAVALGVAQEKDRVEAYLVFNETDPAGVKAGIESGKPLGQKAMAEFLLKATKAADTVKEAVRTSSAGATNTGDAAQTEADSKERKVADFLAESRGEKPAAKTAEAAAGK